MFTIVIKIRTGSCENNKSQIQQSGVIIFYAVCITISQNIISPQGRLK